MAKFISDDQVQVEVTEAIRQTYQLADADIAISVDHARVILSGIIANRSDRRLAELIALDVDGVSEVDNQIRLSDQAATSAALKAQPRSAADEFELPMNRTSLSRRMIRNTDLW